MDDGLTVSVEPPHVWFQHAEGPLTCQFTDRREIPQDDKWIRPRLRLLYADTRQPVISTDAHDEQPIRDLRRVTSIDGTTLTYNLIIGDSTQDHDNRPFCLYLEAGDDWNPKVGPRTVRDGISFVTAAFLVRTRRSKTRPDRG